MPQTNFNRPLPGAAQFLSSLPEGRWGIVTSGTSDVARARLAATGIPIPRACVFGEDVTKHGIGAELLLKLDTLIAADILQNETTKRAHFALPGCAHVEKRGTFTNTKGRVQKFMKAVEPPGDARADWDFLNELAGALTGKPGPKTIEGVFNAMAQEVPAFNGLTWAALGDTGVTVKI